MNLGQKIKNARKKAGLRIEDAAEKTGVSVSYLQKLEIGQMDNPSWQVLRRLSTALSIPIDELLAEPNSA